MNLMICDHLVLMRSRFETVRIWSIGQSRCFICNHLNLSRIRTMRNRYTRLLFHPLHAIRRRIQILHDDQQFIDNVFLVGQILEDGLNIRELGPEELGTAEKQPVTTKHRLRELHCVCSHLEHRVIREGEGG